MSCVNNNIIITTTWGNFFKKSEETSKTLSKNRVACNKDALINFLGVYVTHNYIFELCD